MSYRLAIDVGGTFTDLVLLNESNGNVTLTKTPSTPADPSVGVLTGINKIARLAGVDTNEISIILHGTTVATNAVLEEKGGRVGLITNKGFEQILHVARGQTPGPLAGWIIMRKPNPLAPLEWTRGLSARMSAHGEVQIDVDKAEVKRLVNELHALGIEALTISLLNSYSNPAHELQVKRIAQQLYPKLPVTISTEILPEFREYERTLTTVMNSYLRPKMCVYLSGMKQKLQEEKITATMQIVRSDGGVMSLDAASERPVNTLLSGPSGGAVASAHIGTLAGFPNVLAFDMGGTSTDVSISRAGRPNLVRDTRVGQYPVKVPSVDVHTVGAGGGSIAHVPMTGALRVGPQSAGADPGPACYKRGGEAPTVTDANLVLGYQRPELLGGEMMLGEDEASRAVHTIAEAMGLPLEQAAEGIYDIVNENMFGALRLVSVQRGYDPRDFALLALGGAGPLHANALSMLIGSWPAIIPPTPGVLAALGFLHSDIKTEFSRTVIRTLEQIDAAEIRQHLEQLGAQARAWLNKEKIPAKSQRILYQVDVRYQRQGYEFPLELDLNWFNHDDALDKLTQEFKRVHQQNYSFNIDHSIELVNLRALAIGAVTKFRDKKSKILTGSTPFLPVSKNKIYYRRKWVPAAIFDRAALRAGSIIRGPAVITQGDTTTLILPGHYGQVDAFMNILIWPNRKRYQFAPKASRNIPNQRSARKKTSVRRNVRA